jgi:[ribosomal protein S18]-alanine N-acetyltransferase
MTAPTIRLARNSDAHRIANLSRCLIEVGLRGWSWNPARVMQALRHRECCVVVAEVNREFAGFAIGEFGDTCLHLNLLAVAAAHQRLGIGRALVAWLEKSALTAGITEIMLELRANNPGARYFYESLGFIFERAVPGYYRGEETALRMRKQIGVRTAGSVKP